MIKFFKKWCRKNSGTTAIEFSLLLMPFLMLSFGIIELAVMYTAANVLEGATGSAARLIRTGELQQSGSVDPEADFRAAMCEFATAVVDCADVVIEVSVLNSFEEYTPPVYLNGNLVSGGFDAGASGDRVLIRAAYRYEMLTPMIGSLLTGGTGSRLFVSTVVMQTEPYEFEGA